MIEDSIVRVGRDEAMSYLKPKLDGYRSKWSRVYIGVTSNPEKRWSQHEIDGWKKMVLIYEPYTLDIAIELERDLIDYARRCKFRAKIENVGSGGEGLVDGPRFFLYVLVGQQAFNAFRSA